MKQYQMVPFMNSWQLSHKRHMEDETGGFELLFAAHFTLVNYLSLANRPEVGKLLHTTCQIWPASRFCKSHFTGTQPCLLIYPLPMAASVLQQQSTHGLQNLKYLLDGPLQIKLAYKINHTVKNQTPQELSSHHISMWN